jgi:two-component sensor histidine kinase
MGALSRAHELTLPHTTANGNTETKATTLEVLLHTIVAPYADLRQDPAKRVVVRGPEVVVGASSVTNLALLFHEIATNAAKYGALSSPSGRVFVEWQIAEEELRLSWREEGGPPILGIPESIGFGSTLADATVIGQFGGKISREWLKEGLQVRVTLLLDRLAK